MFHPDEATPNPATLKFLPGRDVMGDGTLEMRSRDEALAASPLAEKLFGIDGVKGVFFGQDFITVTKGDMEWAHMRPAILGAIMEHYMSGAPILKAGAKAAATTPANSSRRRTRRPSRPSRSCWRRASAGGRRGRRRHHVQGLPGRRGLPDHEGLLRGMPVVDGHAQARHPEPAPAFPARRAVRRGGGLRASRARRARLSPAYERHLVAMTVTNRAFASSGMFAM